MERLTQSYGFLFGKVMQQMEKKFAEALTPFNINARQYGILLFISESPYSSQKVVAEKMQVDRTTMVSHIDHLETLNFVKRTKSQTDRRAYGLIITEKGKEVLESCWGFLVNTELEVLSPLNKNEIQSLKQLLKKTWSSL